MRNNRSRISSVIQGYHVYKVPWSPTIALAGRKYNRKEAKQKMNTQLRLALKLITNLLGMSRWKFPSLYSPFLNPAVRAKCKSRRQENGLIVPRSFLTKTTSQAIATKIEDIIHLKLLRNSDEDHCFCNVALSFICEQLKEDEPQSISSRTLML